MEKFNLMAAALMVMCYASVLTSCEKDGNGDNGTDYINPISGVVTGNMTLEAGKTYTLTGSLQVKSPATLTVEKGVRVISANNGKINYILIEKGAKINAVGTAAEPIVFTAEKEVHGAWGGLHICGDAPTNNPEGISEIGNAPYGGQKADDNSGKLRYVRIEYSGYALDSEHEANGLTLYGVGNGTEISYIECYKGSDDGIEFFGGTVNVDHCVIIDCTDDSYDWTEGWKGTAEYLVASQNDPSCDCLMECDNNGNNFAAEPVAFPTLDHLTLVGNGSEENARGIRLRAGTKAVVRNALVLGKKSTVTLETEETMNSFKANESKFENVLMTGVLKSENESLYGNDDFTADGNKASQSISLKDTFVGQVDGAGAVSADDNWTEGWVRL